MPKTRFCTQSIARPLLAKVAVGCTLFLDPWQWSCEFAAAIARCPRLPCSGARL